MFKSAAPVLKYYLPAVRDAGGIDSLIAGLDRALRDVALHALASIKSRQVADALLARVKEKPTPALVRALGAQGDPRAAPALAAAVKSPDKELRLAALEALGRLDEHPQEVTSLLLSVLQGGAILERIFTLRAVRIGVFAPAAIANLDHADWGVRLAATEALGRLRPKEAIPALIAVLQREDEHARVRRAAADALFAITHLRHGMLAPAWQRWFETQGAAFKVPAGAPPTTTAVRERKSVADFYGLPIDSDRLVFVIDISGSMNTIDEKRKKGARSRLQIAMGQILRVAGALPDTARINVVLFSDRVSRWRGSLAPLTKDNRTDLKHYLGQQVTGSATHLYDGIEAGFEDPAADTMVVLTDGKVTGGKITGDSAILAAVRALNPGVTVRLHAVAIGVDSPLLRHLAEESGGRYVER
ncbi:MAG: HEAT repeat domain-containing protein [Planctomycetota bacterium]|jgi:Mg-chelatase subunit ChlD